MRLIDTMLAYGTSEGVQKSWDTRGRGVAWQMDNSMKKIIDKHGAEVKKVSMDNIDPSELIGGWKGARANLNQSRIQVLQEAMKSGKTMTPILVERGELGRYTVLDGHHRFVAAVVSGEKRIPVIVTPKNRRQADQFSDAYNNL